MNYTSVKIPKRLAEIIQESGIYKELGFTSVSSYVLFATRLGYLKVKTEIKNEQR